ncbi:MAG: DUF5106 domain-containing protein [Muribaculaceae bacterium]|nr:DUF5106 domain-containing protein [Muribaculaceae bacterium]
MKLNYLIISTFLMFSGALKAQSDDKLFPYPQPPEDMTNLYERCNFLVYKFWDQCDIKSAFSTRAKLNSAFGDWLAFMPYASADTVYMAIDNFHKSFRKSGEHSYEIAKMAENWLYSDSATYRSDELYSIFVDAAVANKKIPADKRRYFEAQKKILDNSSVGKIVPDIELTKADGSKTSFFADSSSYTIVFIYENDCLDCTFARVRLSADMVLNQLNDAGIVRVVSLYAGEPDAAFSTAVTAFPETWINVASPETADYFDMRLKPAIYYLDNEHKIVGKELSVDNILNAFGKLIK